MGVCVDVGLRIVKFVGLLHGRIVLVGGGILPSGRNVGSGDAHVSKYVSGVPEGSAIVGVKTIPINMGIQTRSEIANI